MADERFTEFHVLYDMSDITALADSTIVTSDNADFADDDLLKKMDTYASQMTLEHNYSVLDGSMEEFDEEPTVPFFSNIMSGADGEFHVGSSDYIPKIDITFTTYHASYGLTVSFIDDPPLQIRCTWYQDNTVLYREVFDVTENDFILEQPVQNYNHVRIEFLKTLPYRYIKINYIRYGIILNWSEDEIKTGSLNLEVDRLSHQLSINTLDFSFVDTTDTTNPGNSNGLHNYFQRTQIMYPYEIINGQKVELGKYFLDSYSYERNLCSINAVSYIGLFDTTPYNKGAIYNGVAAGTIIADIFDTLGIENYEVDEETAAQLLYGTIQPMSCKKALETVLFACHSVIDTLDMTNIRIYKSTVSIAGNIRKNVKLNTKVTKTNYVSGVEIKYNKYELVNDAKEIIKGTYDVGIHTVVLSTPCTNYSISSNASIINDGTSTFVVKFQVTTAGEVVVTAKQYQATENAITVNRPHLEAGEGQNVKSFDTTLCNAATAKALAEEILQYYDNRLEIEVKYFASDINMNERYIIDNPNTKMDNYIGIFTSRSLDLTGGFIDSAKFVGIFDKSSYQYFMREPDVIYGPEMELIAAEDSITGDEFEDEVI